MNTSAQKPSQALILSTLAVALALMIVALFVGREVYWRLIVPASPLNFDEAAHSLPGYYILRDVRNFDVRAFWADTHIQTLWPPGFSYLQAPVLAVLGTSDQAARLFSYIALVLAMLMGFAVIWSIKPEYVPMAGLVSGLIALSAPGWLSLGSLALQETPVALVTFVTFWLFLRALRTGRARWYILTGCAWFFLFLTKYNYAAFALVSIGLVDAGERIRDAAAAGRTGIIRRLITRHSILTFASLYIPVLLGLAFWFLGGTDVVPAQTKWRDFAFFVSNEDSGYAMWSEQNLLFYIRATINWLMPHPLLALATLVAAIWAVARVRHPGVTLLALFFVTGFMLATLHQLKAERYAAPFFPSLWVLAGLGLADVKARWEERGQKKEAGSKRPEVRSHAKRSEDRSQKQDSGGEKQEAGGEVVERGALSLISNHQSLIPNSQSPISNLKSQIPTFFFVLVLAAVAAWSWLTWLPRLSPVWAGNTADALRAAGQQVRDWQQPDRPVLVIGTFGELSPPYFEWRLRTQAAFANGNIQYDAPPGNGSDVERVQHWLDANPGTQVTLIRVDEQSAVYNTADMKNKNAGRQTLVRLFDQVHGYRLVKTQDYPGGGITISYYLPE